MIFKFIIPHYTPLVERKNNIIEQFKKYNINNYEFIEIYDREKLTFYNLEKFQNLRLSEISLFLKQIEALKVEYDIIIILEDDSILCENFLEKINNIITNLPENWDLISCGECSNLHMEVKNNELFYECIYARGGSMNLFNKLSAQKFLHIFNIEDIIDQPIDHWFGYIYKKYELKYFWVEPTLITQGSENGFFNTSNR